MAPEPAHARGPVDVIMGEVIGFILVALVALFGSLTQFYPGNVFIGAIGGIIGFFLRAKDTGYYDQH